MPMHDSRRETFHGPQPTVPGHMYVPGHEPDDWQPQSSRRSRSRQADTRNDRGATPSPITLPADYVPTSPGPSRHAERDRGNRLSDVARAIGIGSGGHGQASTHGGPDQQDGDANPRHHHHHDDLNPLHHHHHDDLNPRHHHHHDDSSRNRDDSSRHHDDSSRHRSSSQSHPYGYSSAARPTHSRRRSRSYDDRDPRMSRSRRHHSNPGFFSRLMGFGNRKERYD
ncbi:hypothetical protein BDZ97DRAFT_1920490 [Flammula alnicola]|nr:hypothetical protein BDZ97DRAFT_1920490 [Flammula alnicola]